MTGEELLLRVLGYIVELLLWVLGCIVGTVIVEKIKEALISFKIFLQARIFHAWIRANQKEIISSVDEFFDIARGSFDLSR